MHWVVQDKLFNEEGFRSLLDMLDRMEYDYDIVKVYPFAHELTPDFNTDAERVIVMGAYTLSEIAKNKGWLPGSFTDNLDFQVQHEHWGDEMLILNQRYGVAILGGCCGTTDEHLQYIVDHANRP